MDTTNLVSWLSFDESATADKCGNSWTAYGSPTIGTNGAISGNALQLDGASYLQKSGSISLGGKDFTIRGWFNVSSSASSLGAPLCIYQGTTRFIALFIGNEGDLWLRVKEQAVAFNSVRDVRQFIEIDYSHSSSITRVFVDGVLAQSIQQSLSRTSLSFVALGNGTWNTSNNFVGSVDEFQIYDGVALHTENFTPPTAEDYVQLALDMGGVVHYEISFDLQRKLTDGRSPLASYISFTGNAGCYGELPLAVLAGATTFTIEAKISTTSTKNNSSNWTWGTIAGREIGGNWQDDFGFCVNDGKLCFWAEPKSGGSDSTKNTTSNATVNDGQIHKVAVVSSGGAIDLYCDGVKVAHTDNVNAKISASQTILLAYDSDPASYLQMDLYEARFWSIARTQEQIFADIDGTEQGLEARYIPSEDGLQDYSGNNRNATLYGSPTYTELMTLPLDLTFDVERVVKNVTSIDFLADVERVIKGKTIYYTVWHKGKPYQIPLTTVLVSPAFATWRQGKDWYNLLVLLDDPRASDIYLRHNGIVYALSLDGESSQGNPPSTPTSIQTPVSFVEHVNKYWLRFDVEDTLDVYDKVADYTTYSRPHSPWTAYGIWASGDSGKYISRGYNFLGIDGMPASVADGFTVDCWAQLDTSEKFGTTPNYATLMYGGGNFIIRQHAQETQAIEFKMGSGSDEFFYWIDTPSPITERFHIAVVVRPPAAAGTDAAEVKLYFNGKCIFKDTTTIKSGGLGGSGSDGYFKLGGVNLAFGSSDYQRQLWRGTIENFRCICGCALWTEDFTPPETFEEYKAQMEAIVPAQPLPEQRTLNAFAPLKIWLTFEYAITSYLTTAINELDFDFCGNRWAVESMDVTVERTHPETAEVTAVSGQALQFVTGALRTCGFVEFGGADFAIDFYGVLYGQSRANAALFYATACSDDYQYFNNGRIFFGHSSGYDFSCAVVDGNGEMHEVTVASVVNQFCHFELDYSHAESALKIFVNGTLTATLSVTVPREKRFVFLGCNKMNNRTYSLTGAINEFRLFDGITLHSGNFTPPTAEDYAAFKKSYKAGDDVG